MSKMMPPVEHILPDGTIRISVWVCPRCRKALAPDVAREVDLNTNELQEAITLLMSGVLNIGLRPGEESAIHAHHIMQRLKEDFGIQHTCKKEEGAA